MNTFAFGHPLLLVVQVSLSLSLFITCFARLTKTNRHTIDAIVLAFWFEGIAALLLACAPFLPWAMPMECPWPVGHTPAWMYALFLAASLSVQVTTAVHWVYGVPLVFIKR